MACTNGGGWDIILAANDFSVLAGVLAGFVITAAAILFASSGRYAPHTLALLAAGVPALALSSYMFSFISGVKPADEPDKTLTAIANRLGVQAAEPVTNLFPDDHQCAQVWSQGVVATAMLTVGGAVLICGLGWVLVTYAEEFRTALYGKRVEYEDLAKRLGKTVDALKLSKAMTDDAEAEKLIVKRRSGLVLLNGWLVGVVTTMTGVILVCVSMVYIKSGYLGSFPHVSAENTAKAGVFSMVGLGLYFIIRSIYTVIRRTVNARRWIKPPKGGFDRRGQRPTRCRIRDMCLTFAVLLVAAWLSDTAGCLVIPILTLVVLTFAIEGVYKLWRKRQLERNRLRYGSDCDKVVTDSECDKVVASNGESEKFDVGRLPETAGNIALFTLGGMLFALLETQMPLHSGVRIFFTLWLGLIRPASITLGLARSTAAATKDYCVPRLFIVPEDKNGEPLPASWLKKNVLSRVP